MVVAELLAYQAFHDRVTFLPVDKTDVIWLIGNSSNASLTHRPVAVKRELMNNLSTSQRHSLETGLQPPGWLYLSQLSGLGHVYIRKKMN